MSYINTGSYPSDLLPGLIQKWFGEYKELPPLYERMFQVEASNQQYDVEATFTPLGASQLKAQGGNVNLDSSQESFKPIYTNLCYASGFEITKEMRMNGHAFKDAKRFTDMLRRGDRIAREIVAAGILNHAGTSGYTMTNGDGVVLASASHPIRGGVRSNILSSAADLSEAAIEAIDQQAMNAVDRRGLHIQVMLKNLIVSPTQKADAHRILKSRVQLDSLNNASYIYDTGLIKDVVVNPYLSSTVQWQVTTDVADGLVFKNRQDPQIDTDNVFLSKNSQVSVDSFFCAGWSDDLGVYISLGT